MPSLTDPLILRQIIMDHYSNPRNKELVESPDYDQIHMDSDSCIDDIYVQVKFNDDMIEDIRFDGVACTIATASTSILTELVLGKSVSEAKEIIENYKNMIFERPYDEDLLEEAIAFQNTYKQANRIKCATIGFDALETLIEQHEKGVK